MANNRRNITSLLTNEGPDLEEIANKEIGRALDTLPADDLEGRLTAFAKWLDMHQWKVRCLPDYDNRPSNGGRVSRAYTFAEEVGIVSGLPPKPMPPWTERGETDCLRNIATIVEARIRSLKVPVRRMTL